LLDGLAKRDADWVEDRLAPMPMRPYEERPDLAAFFALDRPTVYVRCQRGDPAASADLARAQGWIVHEIDGGHLPMIARVAPTAELLDDFARQPATRYARDDRR
ncbi:MAG TPA: hypothetical protein VFL91_22760, partial [Thermomicrobiales bacterium]|nr:hypothetical protein [Thermomicrobiales bacterium]